MAAGTYGSVRPETEAASRPASGCVSRLLAPPCARRLVAGALTCCWLRRFSRRWSVALALMVASGLFVVVTFDPSGSSVHRFSCLRICLAGRGAPAGRAAGLARAIGARARARGPSAAASRADGSQGHRSLVGPCSVLTHTHTHTHTHRWSSRRPLHHEWPSLYHRSRTWCTQLSRQLRGARMPTAKRDCDGSGAHPCISSAPPSFLVVPLTCCGREALRTRTSREPCSAPRSRPRSNIRP